MSDEALRASGVEALIARLHDDGVAAGRAEGERIVAEARREAEDLLAQAAAERETMLARARDDAAALMRGGEAALRLAARDTLNRVRQDIHALLHACLAARVADALRQPTLVADLVRVAAAELTGTAGDRLRIGVSGEDAEGLLAALAALLQADAFAGDIVLLRSGSAGVRISRSDETVAIDFSEEVLSRHLFEHLRPQLRALLEREPVA